MKSLSFFISLIVIILWWGWFLLYSQAQDLFPLDQQQALSRYEMVRLVEESTCNSCLTPPQSWKQKFSPSWLESFQKQLGNSFDEIVREKTVSDEKNYYYCVAHAGEQWWVNGYPRLTPGLCQGKFCGENNARGTELTQMVVNMIAPFMRQKYPLSFKAVKDWLQTSNPTIEDLALVHNWLQRCGEKACTASNLDEFTLFMKYCTSHLESCGMQEITPFRQGQRPIAELNVLVHANILSVDDPMIPRLGSIINGSDMARFLPNIKKITNCSTTNDYDGDGVDNAWDNCPDEYNPRQANMDGDAQGDVCDEDIDGDGSMNEKGLVDDDGTILKPQKPWLDDCPLVSTEKLGSQDCSSYMKNSLIAFDIQAEPVVGIVGQSVDFQPTIIGTIDSLDREFGDGGRGKGLEQFHSYGKEWVYTVTAKAKNLHGQDLVSQAQVIIWSWVEWQQWTTVLTCHTLTGTTTTEFRCFLRGVTLDMSTATLLSWKWWDGVDQKFSSDIWDNLIQNHTFAQPGTYTIQANLSLWLETFISQKLVVYVTGDGVCSAGIDACDLDKDSIPDQCDADIDGDWVTNIVGLVTKDFPDCSFTLENIDQQKYRDQGTAIQKWVKYDNCSFIVNSGQQDTNLNTIWDACDGNDATGKPLTPQLEADRDQDNIPDAVDACIDVPENYNGIEDEDGCPELPKSCTPGWKCSGKAPECTTCPCPGADYNSELWKGDRVRAVLMDEWGTIIYRYSPAKIIDVDIPDKMLGK
jgi:Thrombospondin type 3 repeat